MSQVDPIMRSMGQAADGMSAQSMRLRLSSENLANVDTPGFHRKLVTFSAGDGTVAVDRVFLDRSDRKQIHDPAHPMADEHGQVTLSNVNMMTELADAREAGRSYEANLQAFAQARRLYEGLLSLLRR